MNLELRYDALGKRIRDARKKKRLTQQQVAEKIGVEPSHISNVERGITKPSLKAVVDIAEVLGVTVDSLVYDSLSQERSHYLDSLEAVVKKATPKQHRVITAMSEEMLAPLVKELNETLHGRGGGRNGFAQGSVQAGRGEIEAFFRR